MELITSKMNQNIIYKLDKKLDKNLTTDQSWIQFRCNITWILMHLITSKLDQNIINKLYQKLDKKRINRSKMDAIYIKY